MNCSVKNMKKSIPLYQAQLILFYFYLYFAFLLTLVGQPCIEHSLMGEGQFSFLSLPVQGLSVLCK